MRRIAAIDEKNYWLRSLLSMLCLHDGTPLNNAIFFSARISISDYYARYLLCALLCDQWDMLCRAPSPPPRLLRLLAATQMTLCQPHAGGSWYFAALDIILPERRAPLRSFTGDWRCAITRSLKHRLRDFSMILWYACHASTIYIYTATGIWSRVPHTLLYLRHFIKSRHFII